LCEYVPVVPVAIAGYGKLAETHNFGFFFCVAPTCVLFYQNNIHRSSCVAGIS
jgi:hypothetical protein